AVLAHALPAVQGDATQLRQLIHNLVQNAQEALEDRVDGRVELLTLAVTDRETGNPRGVRLIVRDNGPGFPRKLMARALEPYVTTKVRGTGLGLAIVKKIVDDHGARIELANLTDTEGRTAGAEVSVLFTRMAESVDNKVLAETDTRVAGDDDGNDTVGDRLPGADPAT
ncbi:MAG: hypothetical protein JSW68_06930, partial [Burkholderiales bacterium]